MSPAHTVRSHRLHPRSHFLGMCLALCVCLSMIPVAAGLSGLAWADAIKISDDSELGAAVAFSHDGTLLVSGHANQVMVVDVATREEISRFSVNYAVQSLAFSSDDSRLVIGMESRHLGTPAAVVFEVEDNTFTRARHTEDGNNVDRLSIAPDDASFAMTNEDGGITEWKMDEGTIDALGEDRTYPPVHEGKLTCIDHSLDGQHLLSGAEDGVVILWLRSNMTEVDRWDTEHSIQDCSFSHDGTIFSYLANGALFLRNYDQTHSFLGQKDVSPNAQRIKFSADDQELVTLVPVHFTEENRHIQFYVFDDQDELQATHRVVTGHKSPAFALHPTLNLVAVSTGTNLVALYSDHMLQTDGMPGGIDTDQDGIPDQIDDDDDGDGIRDGFDNICIAGSQCSLHPDPAKMRNIRIEIDGTDVKIIETIHLTSEQSHRIRLLISYAVVENLAITTDEVRIGQNMLCDGFDPIGVQGRWNSALQIEGLPFLTSSADCAVTNGLAGAVRDDRGSRIAITWTTTGWIGQEVQAPYNVTLAAGLPTPSGTVSQIVHDFPVHVLVDDSKGTRAEQDIWNRNDPGLRLLVGEAAVLEPDPISQAFDNLKHYWLAVLFCIFALTGLLVVLMMRRQNVIDFDLDEDEDEYDEDVEEEGDDQDWEEMVDDAAAWDEDWEEEEVPRTQPTPPGAVRRDMKRQPRPPAAVREDISRVVTEDPEPKVRRTISSQRKEEQTESQVDFTHLVEATEEGDSDEKFDEEVEIEGALELFKESTDNQRKRRKPIRRKPQKKSE
jgi:hypothetical protein